jgi:hypothetical protein
MKNHLNINLKRSKAFTFLMGCIFIISGTNGQNIYLTGTDICTDGTQSTEIGITDAKPDVYYALFRDGERISLRQLNSEASPNPISFGDFSQPGKYTVIEYDDYNSDLRSPNEGRQVTGQINIKPMPVLLIKDDPIIIKSGETFSYEPRADLKDVLFTWTAGVVEGKIKKIDDRGKGEISVMLEVIDEKPAKVIFSITPVAEDHIGGCIGSTRDLIINIEP